MFSCAAISEPTKPPAIPDDQRERSRKLQVTGRLRTAIEAMAWEGLTIKQAADASGLTYHGIYAALRKPHVLAFYNGCLDVLRSGERARNIHRLAEIRDAANNMPAVNAIGMLERMGEDANSPMRSGRSAAVTMPGLVIQIIQQADPQPQIVRHEAANPLISLDRDSLHENVDR